MAPRPVRVDPRGDPHAVPERGTAFGNRGVLHDRSGRIVRGWQGRRWIVCVTEFRGRRREPLPPGRYSGLFFRDEATALAAGHRPCFECRRADATAFLEATGCAGLDELDELLQRERLVDDAKPRHGVAAQRRLHPPAAGPPVEGTIAVWPDGELVVAAGGSWRRWAFGALGAAVEGEPTGVLTPPAALAALRAGYRPTAIPLVARP